MPDDLTPGLHEELVTDELLERIERARKQGWMIEWKGIDDASIAAILARHVHDRVLQSISGIKTTTPEHRKLRIAIANGVLEVLSGGAAPIPAIDADARLLLEVQRPPTTSVGWIPTPRPGIPLGTSTLLVNGHNDLQIGTQVALEIQSASRIDLLCAFVRFAGVRLVRRELQEFLLRGGEMRVIASVYTGSTERRALDELVGLGAKVKVSYETAQTRLHAKAWLFQRDTGFATAYVGSSNLTHTALVDGLEWNVRATQVDNAAIIQRIAATFEQYWNEPEFESYDPRVDGARLQQALDEQSGARSDGDSTPQIEIDVAPKPFQFEMLEALAAERQRGHFRNLVVSPTGTGKTWVSAFDYQRLRQRGWDRLLFVAHRDEILRQSRDVFRVVLKDPIFGERYVAGERPVFGEHVFASIQSLSRYVETVDSEAWDVVIVDEFHHAEAATYRRLLEHLRPKVLLGLTATPERADGQDIVHWFDDRIACDMRLWQALDQGLLSPFHYFGVSDGTDLRGVAFEHGRYVTSELENVLTGDHVRARRVVESVREWVLDPMKMRALGFCAGVAHARFMAEQFNQAGWPAVALDGSSPAPDRIAAVQRLRRGELRAIFTVDIFNEGVDIPEVDTLLLLRPTESATVFLQQLGRGLRWAEGKSVLTVLDFIGQAHANYRFDVRFRALLGGTRRQAEQAVVAQFPLMPPGCAIRLDEISQEIVLENIRLALRRSRKALLDDLRGLPPSTTLAEFLDASSFDIEDIYASPGTTNTFTALRRELGYEELLAGMDQAALSGAIGRMLHVDDEERYATWTSWLTADEPRLPAESGTRAGRLQLMLFAALGHRRRPIAELGQALEELWGAFALKNELIQLLSVLRDRSRLESVPIDEDGLVPIHSHGTYSLYEVMAAYGLVSNGVLRENREGVLWVPDERSDVFFITLNKSEADYSPTTFYQDYPISPTLFHWESQSRTAADSPTGRRYINHAARGSKAILFMRQSRRDERGVSNAYLCLGPARYVRHESSRPIRVTWELERPMPTELFQEAKVAAG
jgi:superfamily II DNA or RNA helicase